MLQASKLAPTDAKIYFNLGQFLESASLTDDAAIYYQKAVDLKSNYDYAYFALAQIYYHQKKYDLTKTNLEQTLKYAPANTDAQKMLEEINKIQDIKIKK
jgi:tetratricopeptide (TPR) repeat protein